ncbi:B12-binding domain-containing radical SAM protein [Micromonospora sp. C31]|uniref:B12-binding domain-containing radical SAM protein n=1 Tax=Micromonospora sp. C31 TaxID=2824876 RepID=UPI001B37614E|nr:radical SAM protein [Micromonospora sp. C31]MBQ1076382.1 B12-binding domain-containing radical SAM protein [Micromonospora sp. C31]
MSTVPVPQRKLFWRNFDVQYHSVHPGLRHMKRNMWELPHWMLWLGGVLDAHGYSDMGVLDLYTDPGTFIEPGRLAKDAIEEAARSSPADVYLFSPMTVNLCYAYEISTVIKQIHPRSIIVYGGVAATPLADEVAAHPSVDYVVVDRGERALPALLDALRDGQEPTPVGNLVYQREDGTTRRTATRYPDVAPADLPFPKIDLFPRSSGEDIRYLRQVYALGCPYQCTFCTIQTIGRRPGYFPIERVLREIRAYRAHYGAHHSIYWGDETFTLHPERTLELLDALAREGDIQYDCQTRLNCLTDERVLRKLKSSGCQWIEIGLETGSQDTHHTHKHHMNLNATTETLKRVRDAGLATCAFTVNGFPDQTTDDMARSIDWISGLIHEDLLQATYLFGLVPYPGSTMFQHPERFGMKILHRDFSLYHEDLPPVYATDKATPDQIYQVFLDGLETFAEAMGKRPYFNGASPVGDLSKYGGFWADAHV